jgi:hypothetical protein
MCNDLINLLILIIWTYIIFKKWQSSVQDVAHGERNIEYIVVAGWYRFIDSQ